MAQVADSWHKSRPAGGETPCAEHGLVPSARHGQGRRWQVRWLDGGHHRHANFEKRWDAEQYLKRLGAAWCIVPKCGSSAVTEPPVLLCADHRDLLLAQLGRKRPNVHDPIVYFIRNGSRIKIGWTTNLTARLSSLALPRSAVELRLDGGPELETVMHARFARARVGRTEWFEATAELEAFIARHVRESANVRVTQGGTLRV